MKPIVRWTVGPVSREGMQCLRDSISYFKSLYKDRFDYAICYNGRQPSEFKDLDIPLVCQQAHTGHLLIPPAGPAWKLCPGRLRSDAHEIILDNDLVIYRRPDEIEEFLASDDLFLSSVAAERHYGQFDDLVPHTADSLNSGIIGMPPGYDFGGEITRLLKERPINAWSHFCEQGLVATLIMAKRHLLIRLPVCVPWKPFEMGKLGMHFVGVNGTYTEMWNKYLQYKLI